MAGSWQMIGSRRTFVPPFVNERFDGPPFWACTYTALLNGANVAWLGALPATHAEVAKLAGASGDKDLKRGSRSSHMIAALKRRYKVDMRIESVGPREARRRLAQVAFHYTPEPGSWLAMAEAAIRMMNGPCLGRRRESPGRRAGEAAAWEEERHARGARIHGTFPRAAARHKLRKLYPSIED